MQVSKHDHGQFCWAELATTDGPAAKAFYAAIMGWEGEDSPVGPDMIYTMLRHNGQTAAALYQDDSGKAPPHWATYITVDDIEESAARVKDLGGTVLAGPFDVMQHGRMAVVQDPTGAVFCLWQPLAHIGYSIVNEPGAVCWNELYTSDVDAASKFYSGLFGYVVKQSDMPMPYFQFELNGRAIGGMMQIKPEMGGVPSHWNIYFTVVDCAVTVGKAVSLGATTLLSPMQVPGIGTISVMRDPQSAVFGIVAA